MKQDYKTAVPKEELKASAETRKALLAKWGFEPTSMWYLTKIHNKALDVLVGDTLAQGSYPEHNFNVRDGALPQSSPIVADRLIKFFTEPNDKVFNPFMERIPHLLIANYRGRHAYGQDLCRKFYEHDVEKVRFRISQSVMLDEENNHTVFETENIYQTVMNGVDFDMYFGDSRQLPWGDNSMDFCINSPPYWSTIKYDDNPDQLGTGKNNASDGKNPTYEEFLVGLQDVYKECLRVLKSDKYMAVLLNDFRMKGKFYSYHADCIRICEEIGWKMHDIIIYNLSTHPLQAIFTSQLDRDKHMAKQHEYILVFKK